MFEQEVALNDLREEMLDFDPASPTWQAISKELDRKEQNALQGLANQANTREDDLIYKGKLAIIRELRKFPDRRRGMTHE